MIEWYNEKRKIKDLIPYVSNPRQITEKQAEDLKASLERFGIADPMIINTDNTIIGGHQRKKILETLMGYDPDYEIDVRLPDRELSIDEVRELNVRLNKNVAEWNFDVLANSFELDDLRDWGFEEDELKIEGWDAEPLYTPKIETPIYEPRGEKPNINDIYNADRAEELIDEIKKFDISEEEKLFLILAAYRHVVFNYGRIADYYAHSEKTTQRLMENSALVIVDINKAIEDGYTRFTDEVTELYLEEYG